MTNLHPMLARPVAPSILSVRRRGQEDSAVEADSSHAASRSVTDAAWIDLGPQHDGLGCGSAGTEFVPDRFWSLDIGPACEIHDACSVPLDERMDKPLLEVLDCQVQFGEAILDQADGPAETLGAAVVGVPYVAATTAVAVGHWAVSEIADLVD